MQAIGTGNLARDAPTGTQIEKGNPRKVARAGTANVATATMSADMRGIVIGTGESKAEMIDRGVMMGETGS